MKTYPVLKQTSRHEDVWESGIINPHFLNLDPISRWMVRFTPSPLYPWRKGHRYSLDRKLGGPQIWSGSG